jgi:hypothetical protein
MEANAGQREDDIWKKLGTAEIGFIGSVKRYARLDKIRS